MPERFDRRAALPLIVTGLTVGGLALATLRPPEPVAPRPPVREVPSPIVPTKTVPASVQDWLDVFIPAADGSFPIDQAALRLLPNNIGLSELYIAYSRTIDMINVYTVWDSNKVKTGLTSRFGLNGLAGFQEISDPFKADIGIATNGRSSRASMKEAENFAKTSTLSIVTKFQKGNLQGVSSSNADIFPRPISDKPLALVFGPGYVEYNNALSPLTYLAARFKFEPLTQSVI